MFARLSQCNLWLKIMASVVQSTSAILSTTGISQVSGLRQSMFSQKLTVSDNWFEALSSLGVPTVFDPNDGTGAGALFIPSDVDPVNQTRADARRSYYDPYCQRSNFEVAINSQVTQIHFNNSAAGSGSNSTNRDDIEYGTTKARRQAASLTANGVEVGRPPENLQTQTDVVSTHPMLHPQDRLCMLDKRSSSQPAHFTRLSFSSFPASDHRPCCNKITLMYCRT